MFPAGQVQAPASRSIWKSLSESETGRGGPAPWQSGCGLRRRSLAWYRRLRRPHRPWLPPPAHRRWPRSPPPFPAPQIVGSVARQHLNGGDQLRAGVHHNRRLVSVEPPAAALVAVAHLRIMHQHHPVPAHPVLETCSVISALHVPRSGPGAGSGAATAPAVPPRPLSAVAGRCPPPIPPASAATISRAGPRLP